ncbi:hypothetical protein [Streptomyces sp. NPDC088557]|uniref:hypothetical protein n=1 Tax=Streptomyces sp. NPDC088557 TaxID=3365867 RepID=UPI0037F219F0
MLHSARSRERSRHSPRTALLVPALLTALLGPMLPAGTAFAATAPVTAPVAASATVGLPENPAGASTAVSATVTCAATVCGPEERTVGTLGPAVLGRGKVIMTATGAALRDTDRVRLYTQDYRAESTTVSVSPDRRSMRVALDLTGAPPGNLHASVITHYGWEYQRSGVTVVAALRATAVPVVSGSSVVGGKVTASAGVWSPAGETYAYQWRANGAVIAGATASSYVVPASVLGKKLTVTVTAHRTGHLSGTATSAGLTVAKGAAPKATKAPVLTGTVKVGRTLTLNRGTWTPAPTSYAYQWYANGRAVAGATRGTFTLTKAQRGTKITVRVTAHRTGGLSGVAWTRATGAVAG